MTFNFRNTLAVAIALGAVSVAATAQAQSSITVDFQATIASEQHPDFGGEARFYHVSVNPNNPGVGSFASTIVGTNNPAGTFTRPFTQDVVAYKWVGGANNDINTFSIVGGEDFRIGYASPDTTFDGFGQNQAKFFIGTDPGADIATGGPDPFNVTPDAFANGHRSFGGAVGTVDISGLTTGSLYVFYGAFNATPSLSVVLKDSNNVLPDITIADAHLNGDNANRTEYYLAEIDFVNADGYDTLEYEHLANGTDYTGNGRGIGTLLTGDDDPLGPSNIAGDFNGDGTVDAADYTLWADNDGQADESAFAPGSGNGGGIDATDYTLWRDNFGNTAPPLLGGNGAVPEPGTVALLAGGLGLCFLGIRKSRK